eukprot:COSAG01_NODE_1500_length_10110_cov_4.433923_7_plen_76_part_00
MGFGPAAAHAAQAKAKAQSLENLGAVAASDNPMFEQEADAPMFEQDGVAVKSTAAAPDDATDSGCCGRPRSSTKR